MKNKIQSLFLLIPLLLQLASAPVAALAQDEGLQIGLNKVFGYSGFGMHEVQGVMKLSARGSEDLQRVVFTIDGQTMGEDNTAPFELSFDTGSFPLGEHQIAATGYTGAGGQLQSNTLTTQFVTAQRGMQRGPSFIIPGDRALRFDATFGWYSMPFSRGKKSSPLGQAHALPAGDLPVASGPSSALSRLQFYRA
jgi:hypothetical protein